MKKEPGYTMLAGDLVLVLATFIWVAVSVGPWYLGVVLFAACWALNGLDRRRGS